MIGRNAKKMAWNFDTNHHTIHDAVDQARGQRLLNRRGGSRASLERVETSYF
jgi:hypothetical protein